MDFYLLSRMANLINKLQGKLLFMKMDVHWDYNNVHIAKGDKWKAAFVMKYGLFKLVVMFFGLCNSPADDAYRTLCVKNTQWTGVRL